MPLDNRGEHSAACTAGFAEVATAFEPEFSTFLRAVSVCCPPWSSRRDNGSGYRLMYRPTASHVRLTKSRRAQRWTWSAGMILVKSDDLSARLLAAGDTTGRPELTACAQEKDPTEGALSALGHDRFVAARMRCACLASACSAELLKSLL